MILVNYLKAFLFICSGVVVMGFKNPDTAKWNLYSPNHKICLSVTLKNGSDKQRHLSYTVTNTESGKTSTVIESSPLGIDRKDSQFSGYLSFVSKTPIKSINETYKMLIGRRSQITNKAQEIVLTFENAKGALVQLVLRAYNDGVAFKYVFPETSSEKYTVTKELTGFKIPANGKAWISAYDKPGKWGPAYEDNFQNGSKVGTTSPNAEGWAFPALFKANDNWILLSEANLSANYCGVRLEQKAENGLYKIRLPDARDGNNTGEIEPSYTLPWSMPWRIIIIGKNLSTVFESEMVNNVSAPAVAGDFSWVKAGRSAWSWLTEGKSTKNYNSQKSFVDLAAEMKWEYSLVDADWNKMVGGNVEQLAKYANAKGVGILLWYNSGGPHNYSDGDPRDIMVDPKKRKEEFKKLQGWGVKGVKIDFWQSDKQNLIALYLDVLKDAADYHIMVNFHGCTIPRGWSKTYPNLVTMEAVRGEEHYRSDSSYVTEAPVLSSIFPFTRNVIGPMDYTPVVFSNLKYKHITSYGHELALSIVFNSGILHLSDNVITYRALPAYVRDFLTVVPAAFDETHLIAGVPGKFIVVASRKGQDWYLGGVNSEKEAKVVTIKMPFMNAKQYVMSLITDGDSAKSFSNQLKAFTPGEEIAVKMQGNGGFVATFKSKR